MKSGKLVVLTLLLIFSASQDVLATYPVSTTPDSTYVSPSSVTARIECTRYNFNGTNTNSVPAYTSGTALNCVFQGGGGIGFVGMTGGGSIGVYCPATHPYMNTKTEGWGLVGGTGGAGSSAICCQEPASSVYGVTAWENAVSGSCS